MKLDSEEAQLWFHVSPMALLSSPGWSHHAVPRASPESHAPLKNAIEMDLKCYVGVGWIVRGDMCWCVVCSNIFSGSIWLESSSFLKESTLEHDCNREHPNLCEFRIGLAECSMIPPYLTRTTIAGNFTAVAAWSVILHKGYPLSSPLCNSKSSVQTHQSIFHLSPAPLTITVPTIPMIANSNQPRL